jgi:hypothetical protein
MHHITPTTRPVRDRRLRTTVLIVLSLGVGLVACSDDGNDQAASETEATVRDSSPVTAEPDVDLAAQYCASVEDIEAYAEGLFADLGEDPSIEEQFEAERQVVVYIERQGYDQLELPPEMEEDWRLFYEGFTSKLEAPTPVEPSLESQAAEQRLLEWEAANCTG